MVYPPIFGEGGTPCLGTMYRGSGDTRRLGMVFLSIFGEVGTPCLGIVYPHLGLVGEWGVHRS